MVLCCRFYSEKYPEIDDTVMVNVRSIAEMGAYVSLLEYKNIEGMILLSELSRRRIRSVNKLIRVGRNECVVVIRVDKDKGYIDLSKRRVYTKDLLNCEERFAKAKAVNSILRHVADQLGYDSDEQLEDLYERTAWYFDKKYGKKAYAYEIFKKAISDPSVLNECSIDESTKEKLLEDIKKRLTPQAVKIRADIEVSCFTYEGIDAVRAALKEGLTTSTQDLPIKIHLIAPPSYVVTTNTLDRADGLAAVGATLEKIRGALESSGGNFKIITEPKVVTDIDEKEIRKQLEEMGLEDDEGMGEEDNDVGMTAPADLDREVDDAEEAGGDKGKTEDPESD